MGAVAVDHEPALPGPVRDGHAERVEEREVLVGRPARRREVVPDDQRVRAGQHPHRLQLAEHSLPAAGEAQPRRGQHEPEQGDRLERGPGRQQRLAGERRAGPRVQEVDRHLARCERRQLEREVDPLLERLAETEDAAAAQLHPRRRGSPGRLHPIVVGVRRADAREHRPAGLKVVVVSPYPRGGESPRLLVGQQPERAGHLEARLAMHGVDRLDHPPQQPFLRVADRHDQAELGGARVAVSRVPRPAPRRDRGTHTRRPGCGSERTASRTRSPPDRPPTWRSAGSPARPPARSRRGAPGGRAPPGRAARRAGARRSRPRPRVAAAGGGRRAGSRRGSAHPVGPRGQSVEARALYPSGPQGRDAAPRFVGHWAWW